MTNYSLYTLNLQTYFDYFWGMVGGMVGSVEEVFSHTFHFLLRWHYRSLTVVYQWMILITDCVSMFFNLPLTWNNITLVLLLFIVYLSYICRPTWVGFGILLLGFISVLYKFHPSRFWFCPQLNRCLLDCKIYQLFLVFVVENPCNNSYDVSDFVL